MEELLFFIIFLLVIPIGLVLYENDKATIITAVVWELIFAYRFYQIKIAENEIKVYFKDQRLIIKNISLILKNFISMKIFDLKELCDFELKSVKHARYFLSSVRLIVLLENSEKQILNDFDSKEVAKRVVFMIKKIAKTAGKNL